MKAYLVTLGCPKNTVDSEAAIAMLETSGCTLTADAREADVAFVNGCSFLEAAWQETMEETRKLSQLMRKNRKSKLVLMGCLPVHRRLDYGKLMPWVDHFLPSGAQAELPRLIDQLRRDGSGAARVIPVTRRKPFAGYEDRHLLTPSHTAYVKIAEGCDRQCTFCAIPKIRGPQICRSPSSILREIDRLLSRGVREVTLIAQDILAYRNRDKRLPDLVDEIARTGIEWIRIFYTHPASLTMEIVRRLFEHETVCRYLEMPVQHASNPLLERMNRSHNVERIEKLLADLYSEFPEAVVRSEVLVGFPGETEEDFDRLKEFISSAHFASLGIFPFSSEPGTRAASAGNPVPEELIAERVAEISAAQEVVSFGFHAAFQGKILQILVDRKLDDREGIFEGCLYAGRFYGQAYEIDGEVYLTGNQAPIGEWITARITDTDIYDLKGEIL
jgi:ribosomal protein S12 methylthiotransferase